MNLLPTDELNALRPQIEMVLATRSKEQAKRELEDEILDLLLIAYTFGCEDANEMLGTSIPPTYTEMEESIYRKTAGETFTDRLGKWVDEGSVDGIFRVADTESHRVYCDAELTTARNAEGEPGHEPLPFEDVLEYESAWPGRSPLPPSPYGGGGGIQKTWVTMDDDRVRDTHFYLEGMQLPLDADFITFDGDRAAAPGGFTKAENNVNCRCYLKLTR